MSTSTPAPGPVGRRGARVTAAPVGRTGARFPRADPSPVTDAPATGASDRPDPAFTLALRGYDRGEVDAFVRAREAREQELGAALAAAERLRDEALARAAVAQGHSARPPARTEEQGFGQRAERLLRLAEAEAADVRAQAARDAAELLERARLDAEAERHAAELALGARAAELADGAARRAAELQEREDRLVLQQAAVRTEADRVGAAALRDADRLRGEAEAAAEAVRTRLEEDLGRRRKEAQGDLDRLQRRGEEARAALRRLADLVTAQLGAPGTPGSC